MAACPPSRRGIIRFAPGGGRLGPPPGTKAKNQTEHDSEEWTPEESTRSIIQPVHLNRIAGIHAVRPASGARVICGVEAISVVLPRVAAQSGRHPGRIELFPFGKSRHARALPDASPVTCDRMSACLFPTGRCSAGIVAGEDTLRVADGAAPSTPPFPQPAHRAPPGRSGYSPRAGDYVVSGQDKRIVTLCVLAGRPSLVTGHRSSVDNEHDYDYDRRVRSVSVTGHRSSAEQEHEHE